MQRHRSMDDSAEGGGEEQRTARRKWLMGLRVAAKFRRRPNREGRVWTNCGVVGKAGREPSFPRPPRRNLTRGQSTLFPNFVRIFADVEAVVVVVLVIPVTLWVVSSSSSLPSTMSSPYRSSYPCRGTTPRTAASGPSPRGQDGSRRPATPSSSSRPPAEVLFHASPVVSSILSAR